MGIPVKSILKAGFPFLAAALSAGGPLGTMAASAISTGLGIDAKKPDDVDPAVTAALSANPDAIAKLKEIENSFQLQMRQLGFDQVDKLEAMAEADTANARAREIAIKDNTPKILAYGVIVFTLALEGWLLFHGVPRDLDPVIVGRILGTLDASSTLVLGYYFGSSLGSANKDLTIQNATKK